MKILNDTLKANGKYNRLSLTWFISFIMMILIAISLILISYLQPENKTETVFKVFESFAWLVFGLSGIAVGNRLASSITNSNPNEDLK